MCGKFEIHSTQNINCQVVSLKIAEGWGHQLIVFCEKMLETNIIELLAWLYQIILFSYNMYSAIIFSCSDILLLLFIFVHCQNVFPLTFKSIFLVIFKFYERIFYNLSFSKKKTWKHFFMLQGIKHYKNNSKVFHKIQKIIFLIHAVTLMFSFYLNTTLEKYFLCLFWNNSIPLGFF